MEFFEAQLDNGLGLALATGLAGAGWRLVLDAMVFRAEAEVRWLDHCEASVARYADEVAHRPAPGAAQDQDTDNITRETTAR